MNLSANKQVIRLITVMTAMLALLAVVAPVSIYVYSSYTNAVLRLESDIRVQAIALERVINAQPRTWDLNLDRVVSAYAPFVDSVSYHRVANKQGDTLIQGGTAHGWLFLARSQNLHDFGHPVGRLDVGLNLRPQGAMALIILLLSSVVAGFIWWPVRRLPIAALRQSEVDLQSYQDHLEELVEIRTTALDQALKKAEHASKAKSEFLGSMSHELRTPLNAILGYSQLLGLDDNLSSEVRDQVRQIEDSGHHLLLLVNDIIDLSRIETGNLDLNIEPLDLRKLLNASLGMVALLADKQKITLTDQLGTTGLPQVRADFNRLRQALTNLLTNAIKYNRPNGSVLVSGQVRNGHFRICITDTGLGIAADKQARLFSAFDRLGKEGGTIEGTGIGLVITRRIVEAMGGSVGFTSTEGEGSTFWVELPLTPAAPDQAAA